MTTADLLTDTNKEQEQRQDAGNGHEPLFNQDEVRNLRHDWQQIQGGFVDEPRTAVRQADELVAATMKRLAEVFAAERGRLETEWSRGEEVSTEDLRQALQHYRSFFNRLLATTGG